MIRCRHCNTMLSEHAHFCNVCGLSQNSPEPEHKRHTQSEQKTSDTQIINRCANCSTELPDTALFCVECGTAQVFQASTVLEKTSIKKANTTSESEYEERTEFAKTPGLIRRVTPNSSTHSRIPSRPNKAESTIVTQPSKQISETPAYSIPVPQAKVHPPSKHQDDQHLNSTNMEQNVQSRNKQHIAELVTKQNQVYTHPEIDEKFVQIRSQEQNMAVQKSPIAQRWQDSSTTNFNGKNDMTHTPTMDEFSSASFVATSKAADHWRKSWRDRQYAEAGPSEQVSRGQASVPMPLNPMQSSFVRLRAMKKPDNNHSVNLGPRIAIFVMICLIISLAAYIIAGFLSNSSFAATHSTTNIQPTLSIDGVSSQTVKINQLIHLHGENFESNQSIFFLRDTATPIVDNNGINISSHTDNQGAFQAILPLDMNWATGSHSIEAIDKSSNQIAFLTIQVVPDGTPSTTSTGLSVTMDGRPSSLLKFNAIIGQENPGPQRITITNSSGAPLKWTAVANADNNLNWLMINDSNNYGNLDISQPHSILISVNITGLPKKLYQGQIVFTINNNQQLTLPVQLQIMDATPEMVFSPNPIIAPIGPGNTCQPGISLTLINLGNAAIRWAVNPDDNIKGNIKFTNNGQLMESGTLYPSGSQLPSGLPGDTIVLTLNCNDIQVGNHYHVSVYANQMSWSELVIVE